MNRPCLLACSLAAALTFSAPVSAQTGGTTSSAASMVPEIEVQKSSSGIAYISGGASTDIREAMDKRRGEFPLKVSVSSCSGEYVVANTLTLSGPRGEFFSGTEIGPILMTRPPVTGKITARATYLGETQTRSFSANTKQTVNICFKTRG